MPEHFCVGARAKCQIGTAIQICGSGTNLGVKINDRADFIHDSPEKRVEKSLIACDCSAFVNCLPTYFSTTGGRLQAVKVQCGQW